MTNANKERETREGRTALLYFSLTFTATIVPIYLVATLALQLHPILVVATMALGAALGCQLADKKEGPA